MNILLFLLKEERKLQYREYRQVFRKGERPERFPLQVMTHPSGEIYGFQTVKQLREVIAKRGWNLISISTLKEN